MASSITSITANYHSSTLCVTTIDCTQRKDEGGGEKEPGNLRDVRCEAKGPSCHTLRTPFVYRLLLMSIKHFRVDAFAVECLMLFWSDRNLQDEDPGSNISLSVTIYLHDFDFAGLCQRHRGRNHSTGAQTSVHRFVG